MCGVCVCVFNKLSFSIYLYFTSLFVFSFTCHLCDDFTKLTQRCSQICLLKFKSIKPFNEINQYKFHPKTKFTFNGAQSDYKTTKTNLKLFAAKNQNNDNNQ